MLARARCSSLFLLLGGLLGSGWGPGAAVTVLEGDGRSLAQEKAEERDGDSLKAWGTLKAQKAPGEFTLTYRKVAGKGAKSETVNVKVPAEVETFRDAQIRVQDLKVGDKVWLFGRPIERETPTKNGFSTGTDRQIQNTAVIAVGEGLDVNTAYKDPRDPNVAWLEGVVDSAGAAIWVKHQEQKYKVVMAKDFAVLRRSRVEKPTPLKGSLLVAIVGSLEKGPEAGASGKGAAKPTCTAAKVVLLEKKFGVGVYPRLLE